MVLFLNLTVGVISGGVILLLVLLYFLQDKLIFKPEILRRDFEFSYKIPFKELFFDVQPGVSINGLHFYREKPEGLILYFHGNTRSIKGWGKYATDFTRYNYDVVLVDYRGFGKSTGKRSEAGLMADMQFIYDQLQQACPPNHLLLYGRSLGSGFASKLASDNSPRYLILDAPFYNFSSVAERFLPFLPLKYLLMYQFRTDRWIKQVQCHTYILHGTRDRLIPISQSERLQKIDPHKITLIRIQGGGHNNLPSFPEYHNILRDILKS